MNLIQLQREGPRLVAMHTNLIQPAATWRKAQTERRFKQCRATLEALDPFYVAELCIEHTGKVFGKHRAVIMGERRFRDHVLPRYVAMTTAYELSGLSSIVLGVKFNRGHDMILWAQKRVNGDKALRAQADEVVRAVKRELRKK